MKNKELNTLACAVASVLILLSVIIFLMGKLNESWNREEELHKQIRNPSNLHVHE